MIKQTQAQCPVVPSYVTCGELIYNNSFEYSSFPFVAGDQAHCAGELMYACIWEEVAPSSGQAGTPDLYNVNFSPLVDGFCDIVNCSIPTSWAGYQTVIPGSPPQQGYAGIFTLDKHTTPTPAYREYLIQHLTTPILPMETVTVSLQVSLAEISSRFTTISVGFLDGFFGSAIVSQTSTWMDIAPANKHTFNTTADKTLWQPLIYTWTNLTGTTVTDIVIGNFDTDAYITTTYSPTQLTHQTWPAIISFNNETDCAYYFIDDVSIQKTQTCCEKKDAVFINLGTGPGDPDSGPNDPEGDNIYMSAIYSQIAPTLGPQSIFIQGELIIDVDFVLSKKDVTFGFDSKVTVQAGKTFTVTGTTGQPSHLHGCDRMWRGIFADQLGSFVQVFNSIIEDAKIGVYTKNTGNAFALYSKFYNNYVGIQYDYYTSSNNNQIRACTFQSNFTNTLVANGLPGIGYLLPGYNIAPLIPMEGKRGVAGILMNYSSLVLRPAVPTAGANTFYRMQNGIVAYNSNLKVSNATFLQIRNHDGIGHLLDNGRAITAINTSGASTYSLQADNTTGQIITNFCDIGVWVEGKHTTIINNNKMNNTTYRAICHANVFPISAATQLTVANNKITNAYEGIFYQYCYLTPGVTNNNTISNNYIIAGSRGIIYENQGFGMTQLCATDAADLPVQIINNNIKRFGIGINTSFASCLNIDYNTIDLLALNYQHHGIAMNKSPFNVVTNNIVNGNHQDWRCIGIRVFNSNGVQAGCNTIDKTEIAFFLDNDCNFSRFAMNTITNYNKGFTLLNSAKLGSQASISGFDYNLQNVFDKIPATQYEFAADQTVVGSNSVFFFKPGTGAPTDITNINGALLDNLGNVSYSELTSPTNFPDHGFSPALNQYLDLREELFASIAGLGYNFCGDAPGASPIPGKIIEGFNSGYIANVGFTPFYEPEHTWMFKHNALRDYKLVKDSLNTATLPSSVVSFIDSLYASNVAELDSVETLIGMGNYAQAYSMNSICNASCNYSNKLKETNQLLIPQWDSLANNYLYHLTDTVIIQSIIGIANLCINEYGDAVLKARVFARNHIDPMLQFYNPCEDLSFLQPHSQTISGGVLENPDYILYPNPANDMVTLISENGHEIVWSVTDIQGRKIAEGRFTDMMDFDAIHLQTGIYLMVLFDLVENQGKTIRFIVSH